MNPRAILVIDDNPEERKIFSTYLTFVGGQTLQACNGAEGMEVARDRRPNLILLDLTMPVQDGWETIRALRDDPETRSIPVIAVTSHRLEWTQLRDAGFTGYLEKPIAPFKVLEQVERCLGPLCEEGEAERSASTAPGWDAPPLAEG